MVTRSPVVMQAGARSPVVMQASAVTTQFCPWTITGVRTPSLSSCGAPVVSSGIYSGNPCVVHGIAPASISAAPSGANGFAHGAPSPYAYPSVSCQPRQQVSGGVSILEEGLRRLAQRLQAPTVRDHAYVAFLELLASKSVFEELPLDRLGVLDVNVPHCGGFSEAPLLLPFLAARVLEPVGRAKGLRVRCCDLEESIGWWTTFLEWSRRTQDPRVELSFEKKDLTATALPTAGLVLSIHPGPELAPHLVTPDNASNPWRRVLENVLKSRAPGGRCVFASFYLHEVDGIRVVCKAQGVSIEAAENPYYQTDPMPAYTDHVGVKAHPLRYISFLDS